MKIIRIASQKSKRKSFYSFLKTQNITIRFYHGTSQKFWEAMKESGWMTPPTWRGKEEEEARFDIRTDGLTEEKMSTMKGLDKLFLTKSKDIAQSYADRSSSDSDPAIVLQVNVPLHKLDEIKGYVEGEFVYNETGSGRFCAKVIDSNLGNQEKLDKILEYIDSSEEDEWTIKGGLRIRREKGYEHILPEDELTKDEKIESFSSEDWDYWPHQDPEIKFDKRVIDKFMDGYSSFLREDAGWNDIDEEDDLGLGGMRLDPRLINAEIDAIIRLLNYEKHPIEKENLRWLLSRIPSRLVNNPRLTNHIQMLQQ